MKSPPTQQQSFKKETQTKSSMDVTETVVWAQELEFRNLQPWKNSIFTQKQWPLPALEGGHTWNHPLLLPLPQKHLALPGSQEQITCSQGGLPFTPFTVNRDICEVQFIIQNKVHQNSSVSEWLCIPRATFWTFSFKTSSSQPLLGWSSYTTLICKHAKAISHYKLYEVCMSRKPKIGSALIYVTVNPFMLKKAYRIGQI